VTTTDKDSEYSWRPSLLSKQKLFFNDETISIEQKIGSFKKTHEYKLKDLNSVPISVAHKTFMPFIFGTIFLLLMYLSVSSILYSNDYNSMLKSSAKAIFFVLTASGFFIQYWRRNGIFIHFQFRSTKRLAFFLPKINESKDFIDKLTRAIHLSDSISSSVDTESEIFSFGSAGDMLQQAESLRSKNKITEEEFQNLKELYSSSKNRD